MRLLSDVLSSGEWHELFKAATNVYMTCPSPFFEPTEAELKRHTRARLHHLKLYLRFTRMYKPPARPLPLP